MTVNHVRKLYYTVANHLIAVDTFRNEPTARLLKNFDPFRNKGDLISDLPIVKLACNQFIPEPSTCPVEQFHRNLNHYALYSTQRNLIIEMTRQGKTHRLMTSSDWQSFSTDLSVTDKLENLFLNNFIMIAYTIASSKLKTIKLHASVIEKNGKALLFLGKSGTGKSTHSRLWQKFVPGSTLLNDDEPVVRLHNESVKVYGTPWSGKTPCYRNISGDVMALICLVQSPENKLTRLEGLQAFLSVFQSCSVLRSNKKNKDLVFDTVARLIETVPVYRLDCRPDREAVSLTESLLPNDK